MRRRWASIELGGVVSEVVETRERDRGAVPVVVAGAYCAEFQFEAAVVWWVSGRLGVGLLLAVCL